MEYYNDRERDIIGYLFYGKNFENGEFESTSDVLKFFGFYDSYSEEELRNILKRDCNEVERIIVLCKYFHIDFSPKSNIWARTFDELTEITKYVNRDDISLPFQNGGFLYTRTVEEIKEIVGICRDKDIQDWEFDDSFNMAKDNDVIFKHTPDEIRKIIDYCEKEHIFYNDQKVFEFHSYEEVVAGHKLCKKLGIDFSNFLGANDEFGKELWVMYNGTQYLLDDSGEKLLRCYNPKGDIEIPSIVTRIGTGAFEGCNELHGVTIHENVNYVGINAFKNCTGLFEVEFLGELNGIGASTFEGCSCLRKFTWPKNLVYIGESAFKNSAIGDGKDSEEPFTLPSTIRNIFESAFEGCHNIYNLVCPNGLEEAQHKSFYDCRHLSSIKLSDNTKVFDDTLNRKLDKLVYGNFVIPADCFIADENFIYSAGAFRSGYSDYHSKIKNIHSFCYNRVRINNSAREFPRFYPINCEFNDDYNEALVRIIAACLEKDIFKNIFSKMSVDIFYENAEYFINMFDELDGNCSIAFPKMVLTGNNYNILSVPCDDARKNFEYLASQKIISYDNLKKLFFGDVDGNDFDEMLKNYYKEYGALPELYNALLTKSNDKNKLELRDRLVYISTMQLLDDDYSDDRFDEAISMMGRTLFENVIDDDKMKMSKKYRDLYSIIESKYPEMMGIMYSLYEKMNGIDSKWFKQLMFEMRNGNTNSAFIKFYQSLETIKNWNQFDDEIVRATHLKNEIVGRLLYADINLTCKKKISVRDYIRDKANANLNGNTKSLAELLEYASKSKEELFRGNTVSTLLTIDPYSFDALRYSPSYNGLISVQYAQWALVAKRAGYMFSPSEVAMCKAVYNHNDFNKISNIGSYAESVINSVGIPKIPVEKRKEYLEYMKNMSRVYVQNQSEADLFKFCRSLDLYLRNNNEYVTQGEESEKVAKIVFDIDGGIDNDSRVLYCLYNLNKIAHGTLELNVNAALANKFRVVTEGKITYKRMKDVFDSYNILYRYGLNEESINYLLGKGVHRSISDLILKEDSLLNADELTRVKDQIKESVDLNVRSKPLNDNDVKLIRKNLKFISMMTEVEEKIISTSVKEQGTFFECKRIFSEEVMKRMVSEFSSDFKEMLEASLAEKQKFYAKHGYVAEVQDTDIGPTLVCLCEKFREPFSVHLKDLPDNIATALNAATRTETIAHGSLRGRGLTLRDGNYESEIATITDPMFVGFKDCDGFEFLPASMKSNFENYDKPAKRIREEMARQSSRSELEGMFSEGANNASGANTNTGGNKHQ